MNHSPEGVKWLTSLKKEWEAKNATTEGKLRIMTAINREFRVLLGSVARVSMLLPSILSHQCEERYDAIR
jgi:hypothetical protein